jgi:hypothetical protein
MVVSLYPLHYHLRPILYPICTTYVGYMKSKIFQNSQNKAKIGQKSQNCPNRPQISKLPKKATNFKKSQKKAKIIFWKKAFFGKSCIFWKILYFLEQVAVCHFGGYIRTT